MVFAWFYVFIFVPHHFVCNNPINIGAGQKKIFFISHSAVPSLFFILHLKNVFCDFTLKALVLGFLCSFAVIIPLTLRR